MLKRKATESIEPANGAVDDRSYKALSDVRHRRVSPIEFVLAASLLALAAVVAARWFAPEALYYSPYPPSSLLPPFEPLASAALLLLVAPTLTAPAGSHAEPIRSVEHDPV